MKRALLAPLLFLALPACDRKPDWPRISVEDVWARETLPGQPSGAVYLTLRNDGGTGDRLLGVSSPASASATLHSSSMVDGIARMRPLAEGLAVPAGEAVKLEPNGTHVMLTRLGEPLRRGRPLVLSLRFERSGALPATGTVFEAGAPAGHGGH